MFRAWRQGKGVGRPARPARPRSQRSSPMRPIGDRAPQPPSVAAPPSGTPIGSPTWSRPPIQSIHSSNRVSAGAPAPQGSVLGQFLTPLGYCQISASALAARSASFTCYSRVVRGRRHQRRRPGAADNRGHLIMGPITPKQAIIRAVLSMPGVRRRASPQLLGRTTSFDEYCAHVGTIPARIGPRGFHLSLSAPEIEVRAEPSSLEEENRESFWQQVKGYQGGLENHIAPRFIAGLRDASLLASAVAIRSYDNYLFHDPFHHPKHVRGVERPVFIPRAERRLRGGHIHMTPLWGQAHYHWVMDVLPRLAIVDQHPALQSLPLVLPSSLTPAQCDSLKLLGIPSDRIVKFDGRHWTVDELYYPSGFGITGNPTKAAVRWLRERFAPSVSLTRRLYVSRRDVTVRRIVNESDLVEKLLPLGFEIVNCGALSFSEQVKLFSEAAIIVGAHGGGLTNMVFAQPGSSIIEVFPPKYINGCFWALANACGHSYAYTIGTQREQDIEVEVEKVLALISRGILLPKKPALHR
jgi:capsular polysaccharide biosynthesis protein